MDEALTLFDVLGVRVHWVADLGTDALVSVGEGIAVLDQGLTAEQVAYVADEMLTRAAAAVASGS